MTTIGGVTLSTAGVISITGTKQPLTLVPNSPGSHPVGQGSRRCHEDDLLALRR